MQELMVDYISAEIERRGITRICHFTNSRKALEILRSESGIIAVDFLAEDLYDANDSERRDGKKDYINCSIQYPNFWYYRRAKEREKLFEDWVILFINPNILLLDSTKFCITNAAFKNGAYINGGVKAFKELFDDTVYGKCIRTRTSQMLSCCPTDDQAEVLVYRNILRKDIFAIGVKDEKQADRERRRWSLLPSIPDIDIIVAPDLFSRNASDKIRSGQIPEEYIY